MKLPLELTIECLKYLDVEKVLGIDIQLAMLCSTSDSWFHAIENGSDLALSFLHLNSIPSPCPTCMLHLAISKGNLSTLKYLLNHQLVKLDKDSFRQTGMAKHNGLEMAKVMVGHEPIIFAELLGLDSQRIKSISLEIVEDQDSFELQGRYFDFGGFQLYGADAGFESEEDDNQSLMSFEIGDGAPSRWFGAEDMEFW